MDSRLYETKLANHKIFKDLKDSLSKKSDAKLSNLIELRDEVLYAWNSNENCLFCVNLKHLEEHDDTPYQKIIFSSPPVFEVERLMSSECGTRLCVWGSRGVTVAELPSRWGRSGLFESGKPTVFCKSFSLDERFLFSQCQVIKVLWHPHSLSHILVLVSDNTMRVYNIALKTGPKRVKPFGKIGPRPQGPLGMAFQDGFGDSAVDMTATPDGNHLLVLTGNGDVYMMSSDFLHSKGSSEFKVQGPLSMYPPADDNYGSESCAIAALGAVDTPAVVVIATASAALYHCLLLPKQSDTEGDEFALYVVESVDLDIVLNTENDVTSLYPVHLYPCSKNTYVCVHAGGVHTVTLAIMEHLKDYAMADDSEMDSVISIICAKSSSARHLVCTSDRVARPPVGVALSPAPLHHVLVLCCGGDLLTRTLEPFDMEEGLYKEIQLKNPMLDEDDMKKLFKEKQKVSFTSILMEILSRDMSQPILKMEPATEPSPKECLEILTEATVKLRNEYMSRQERATRALRAKLEALRSLGNHQRDWQKMLLEDIAHVHLKWGALKSKREQAVNKQEDIKHRCAVAIRYVRSTSRVSPAELEMVKRLEQYKHKADTLLTRTRALRDHADDHLEKIKKWQEEYKKQNVVLGKSHSETISSILQQQTNQVSTLIEETKLLKDQLGVM
ncbi:nucleoporin 88 [Leptidea sinapis]|uniref:nucleoporin 88 n=1 Tax=Leptidea sinapis TaxID=189913 RepID=UPI002141C45F|nr:nucleoporin 88 [Leptidea sinapis]